MTVSRSGKKASEKPERDYFSSGARFRSALEGELNELHESQANNGGEHCSRRSNIDPPCRLNIDPGMAPLLKGERLWISVVVC